MKYHELTQIATYLQSQKKLACIKRIEDSVFLLDFINLKLIFDLTRSKSGIYQAELIAKNYNAPFDVMLKKYFSNALIKDIQVLKNNRILSIHTQALKAYKSFENIIFFEFTGKNTNVIITDENLIIIEALRHIEKSYRSVELGKKLQALQEIKISEKFELIEDFNAYFKQVFCNINESKLKDLKASKHALITKKITQNKLILARLEKEEDLLLLAQQNSHKASVLLAHLYEVNDYERNFKLTDFDGKVLEFKLELPAKYAVNDFFAKAKKLKQKAKNIHIQRQNLEEKIIFYERLLHLAETIKTRFELEVLFPKKAKKEKTKELDDKGVVSFYFNEFKILVGRNEAANVFLLEHSKKDDMWLHVQALPSAHVFIVSNKQKLSQEVLQFAAKLCVNFSKLNSGAYLVDYTQRKFVKIKHKALVNYTNYQSLSVLKE